jgi:hypothetical protein
MRHCIAVLSMLGLGFAACAGLPPTAAVGAEAADCTKGSTEEQVACLNRTVADLTATVEQLVNESIKWNDRISLLNEDMRIFPRCLENPGPDTRQLTDVFASSCAKTPSQAWMIRKPYH